MKKKTKKACKILSVFLALLIAMQILPLQVLAENIAELLSNQGTADTSVVENTDVSILYEVEEKRDEYTKVYKKSDGTYTAVKTIEPLHYLKNDVWEEINNSMSLNGSFYTNLDNLFNVEFPESIDSYENLTVEKDGYELSFSIDNIEESSAVVENDIVVSDTNITVADEAIAQTQSSVTYNDIAKDTDLQYIVTPNSIKENIIVSNKKSVKDTYTFTFETNGLDAEKLDDGSVVFKDENDEIKFKIPRPVMTDSNLAFSYDININLIENSDETITLEYSPSKDWTSNSDRVYPITIDPAITVGKYDPWVEDTYVAREEIVDSTGNSTVSMNGLNYSNTDIVKLANQLVETDSKGNTITYDSKIYTKIKMDFFENLGKNIVFTEVQYIFAGAIKNDGKFYAKEILNDWKVDEITYNDQVILSDTIIDYYTSPSSESATNNSCIYVHFNITKYFNEWFNGNTNNGFAIIADEDAVADFALNGGYQCTAIAIDYVEMGGYNENFNYHSQAVGRAGTGYVNDFTQSLSVIRDELSIDGNIMPVTVGMIYNSASYDKLELLGYQDMMAYGNNWTPNYLRAFVQISDNLLTYYTENGSAIDYTYYVEGNEVIFEEIYSDFYGEHGYEIEYFPATDEEPEHIVITRPDGLEERFNEWGLLTSVTNSDYPSQNINIVYDTVYRINYITDGVNRKYDYVYNNTTNLLSKIKCYSANGTEIKAGSTESSLEVNYAYDENKNLTSVTFPDGKSASYTYDENGNITSIVNIDGYRIEYDYQQISKPDENGQEIIEQTDKVIKAIEKAYDDGEYKDGKFITYERLNTNQIKLTDATGDYEIYHFGTSGNLLYTIDNNGNYVMHEDVDSTTETHFASVSDYRAFSENLLSNPSFEEIDPDGNLKNWESSKTTCVQSDDVPALFGTKVLKISSNENESINIKQSVDIVSGGDYTFSAYIKTKKENTTNTEENLTLKVYYGDIPSEDSMEIKSVETTIDKWERFFVTIEDVPNDINEINVEIEAKTGNIFYVDGVQLEQSSTESLYNYLSNGSFNKKEVDENSNEEYILDSWSGLNNPNFVTENINGKTVNALVLPGGENEVTEISQTITIDGKVNDVIRVGGWFKGNYVKSETNNVWLKNIDEESGNPKICNFTDDRDAYIEVKFINTKTHGSRIFEIPFNENLDNWQFIGRDFSLSSSFDKATITIHYSNNINTALLSNVELTKTKVRTTSVEDGEIQCPCANCAVINCSCNCTRELYCYCAQCLESKNTRSRQDSFGEIALGNNYDEIAVVQFLTQRIGDNVTANFNLSNGLLKDFYDAVKKHSTYTYDSSGVLKEISYTNDDGNKENLVLYEYNNDRLQYIIRNGFAYGFSYDCWGQLVSISVGETFVNENNKRKFIVGRSMPIVSYEYNENEYRDRIVSLTYHNDDEEINNYSESVTIDFGYDNKTNEINSILINGNDRTDILNAEINDNYTAETDANNNLIETIGGETFKTELINLRAVSGTYYETKSVTANNLNSTGTGIELDITGRYIVKKAVIGDINEQSTDIKQIFTRDLYQYIDTATPNQSLEHISTVCYDSIVSEENKEPDWSSKYSSEYEYDNNGNVVTESIYNYIDSNQKQLVSYTTYEYTEFNQLKRVNQLINNSHQDEKSITYFYTYDKSGNITSKAEYPYTTSEKITSNPNSVINYQYNVDNSIWKDRLDSTIDSNGTLTNIEYDNIGNPHTIGNEHFTWSGRLLQSYENTDTGEYIEYQYDKNGLCNKKIVYNNNKIIETHDYVWSEGRLVSQIYTDSTLAKYVIKYVYDLYNTPYGFILCYSGVQENGESKNGEKRYLFRKNMKEDIVAIVNESGNDVINYEYDVWGVTETYANNSVDDVLKNIESSLSLRYRGYSYDTDTNLYYIQGRYYSPELCRFINADNMSNLGSTETALGYNLYTYCENNPVMYVVDNRNTEFSNTINSNYIYNKRISQNSSGFIDDQKNGIASKLRYGINTISPVGCGCVATYNALLMLGNPIELCDIIREIETNKPLYYGLYGTHIGNIGRFLATKGYNITVTFACSDNMDDNIAVFDPVSQDQNVKANILLIRNGSVAHYIALKYNHTTGEYIAYNTQKKIYDKSSIGDFISSDDEPMALISIYS